MNKGRCTGMTLPKLPNITGPQYIYAKDYDQYTGDYLCVNSWGPANSYLAKPRINKSRIYAVDYVSIVGIA